MLRRCLSLFALSLVLACPTTEPAPLDPPPEPGEFQAGAAVLRMPVPVGIGTSGYGFFGGPDSDSPYADSYPATTRVHGHPDIRAVMYSRGEGFELILVRIDMIAAIQQLRDAVLAELLERTGRDWDDALVLNASHTHSGPGRFIQGFFSIIADEFFPAHYERLVGAIADTIETAHADLAPAELAVVRASAPEAHKDRRCEDGETYSNDDAPLIAVQKDGVLESVVVSYAIHGTTLGMDDLTLSQDVSGSIEAFTEITLAEDGVMVMMMNSWAGDVSPRAPSRPAIEDAAVQPEGYDQMERVGSYLGEVVASSLATATFDSEPTIEGRTYRYPIGHRVLGYELGEFPFLFGGVYCTGGEDCSDENLPEDPQPVDGLDEACAAFPETSPAPEQTMVTVGRVGNSHFTTWAGECGTRLAERTMAEMGALDDVGDIIFFGYSNDYLGYALEYEDWYYGGYEASGSIWGPRQGEYMSQRSVEAMTHYVLGGTLPFEEPERIALFDLSDVSPVFTESSLDVGDIVEQPQDVAANEVVRVSVYGSDAWFGAPTAVLQTEGAGGWEDVLSPSGAPITSDGYGYWTDLTPDPPFLDSDELPRTRHFRWSISMPATSRYTDAAGLGAGTYRFRVMIPTEGEPLLVETESFTVQ